MKLLNLIFAMVVLTATSLTGNAQCCCSWAEVTITNGAGFPLEAGEVKVRDVSELSDTGRAHIAGAEKNAKIRFRIGCGTGNELMLVEHQSAEMRIRFNLRGEFPTAKLEVPFVPGDHVIEFENPDESEGKNKVFIRPADGNDVAEADRIQKAHEAAARDKAAKASGPDTSP
jgi:hypothetical protein